MGTLGHLNSSGFPFQMAIGNHVDANTHKHGFNVLYSEHSWSNSKTQNNGFIDLVLLNNRNFGLPLYFVVECKKSKVDSGNEWVFLNDVKSKENGIRSKALYLANNSGMSSPRIQWVEYDTNPPCDESQYCVVTGKQAGLVEREASILVQSVEGFGEENKEVFRKTSTLDMLFFPMIVTNTPLKLCKFESSEISILDSGEVPDNHDIQDIPYIKFRKQLLSWHSLPTIHHPREGNKIVHAKEQTVYVVNSGFLTEFLTNFEWLG